MFNFNHKIQNYLLPLAICMLGTTGCVTQRTPVEVIIESSSGANPSSSTGYGAYAPASTGTSTPLAPTSVATPTASSPLAPASTGSALPGQQPAGLAYQTPAGALVPVPGGYVIQSEPAQTLAADAARPPVIFVPASTR